MVLTLRASDSGFDAALGQLIAGRQSRASDVDADVATIINEVRAKGDAALIDFTEKFDDVRLTPDGFAFSEAEIDSAVAACDAEALAALRLAAGRIEAYHARLMPEGFRQTDDDGVLTGARWVPVESAGIYVPGGTASYPSSVLMNAIPARVAGAGRIAMMVPAPGGTLNPLVLAAARIAGVEEIYRLGGAQAIAALAYGTESILPVDMIVGPGNVYVAAAKRQVFGTVGIDMMAGPSEILVVADADSDPNWIAADLLSQAEHDARAQSILIVDDADYGERVISAVRDMLVGLARSEIAAASWQDYGAVIVVDALADAPAIIDRIAPEHLELAVAEPDELANAVRNAGAIFLGRYTPEAVGDYVAGPSHVLPTSGSARFSSGLGVHDFLKRISIIGCGEDGLARIGGAAMTLARREGLDAHALSLSVRLKGPDRADGA